MIFTAEANAPQSSTEVPAHHAYLEAIGKVFFYVYASSAVQLFPPEELRRLLETSRRNNAARGVSGMLLYKDGNFLQVLEGREADVLELAAKIHADPRHRGVITLMQGFESEYQFPDWSMGFCDLRSDEAKTMPGYSAFLESSFDLKALASDPTAAQRLLLSFKKNM
jgi:hypothetical protein